MSIPEGNKVKKLTTKIDESITLVANRPTNSTIHDPSLSSAEPRLSIKEEPLSDLAAHQDKKRKLCAKENSDELEASNTSNPPTTRSNFLWSMYEEEYMSDFSIEVKDQTFRAHRAILGARSSYFKEMFDEDVKKFKHFRKSAKINFVTGDTFQNLLNFIYSDSVQEDMQLESYLKLYVAASKFGIMPLEQRCFNILKTKLCTSNVYLLLEISSMYSKGQDLNRAALEFIEKNDKHIIGTDRWHKFEMDRPHIAIDVLRKLYIRKMNG